MKNNWQKLTYKVDPLNRLVITEPFAPNSPLYKKVVLDGKFTIDKDNSLIYHLTSRLGRPKETPLHKIKFTGKWSLTPEHNLKLSLFESRTQKLGNSLILTGNILTAGANELVFSYTTRHKDARTTTKLLKIKGTWQANRNNRLKFLAQQYRRRPDELLFRGGWEIGKNYEIIYCYRTIYQKRGIKLKKYLVLNGVWEIAGKNRLRFLVEKSTDSLLDFRVMLETPSIFAKKGEIRYRIGIRITKQREIVRKIVFFGKWKLGRKLALDFEIEYKDGVRHSSRFIFDYCLDSKDKIKLALKTKQGEGTGLEITFSRQFFKNAEGFMKFRRAIYQKALEGGIRLSF